ncbi:MAG TPA: AAA family ATPase [Isosphaeraceae bacterium]|jgi:capsular exopolysaccharide synthesis family protein
MMDHESAGAGGLPEPQPPALVGSLLLADSARFPGGAAGPPPAPWVAPSASTAAAFSPLDLLKALRRRPWIAFGLSTLCAALAGAVTWYMMPLPKYSAVALLHVDSNQPRLVMRTAESNVDLNTFQRTQTTLIKSLPVLNAALKQRGVGQLKAVAQQEDPVTWLDENLQVGSVSEIIRISFDAEDPQTPALLVNAVTDAYLQVIVNKSAEDRRQRLAMLQTLYDDYQVSLRDSRKKLKDLAESLGSNDQETISKFHQMAMARQGDMEKELRAYEADLRRVTAEAEILRSKLAARPAPGPRLEPAVPSVQEMLAALVRDDPLVQRIDAELAEKEQILARARGIPRNPGSDPTVRVVEADVGRLRHARADRVAALVPQAHRERTRPAAALPRDEKAEALEELEDRIAVLMNLRDSLSAQVERQSASVQKISTDAFRAEEIKDEILHADSAAKSIGAEIESLKIELKAPPRIQTLQRAEVPKTRESSRKLKMTGGAAAGAFALVLVGLALTEYRARRIDSIDDVARGVGVCIVGTLPAHPSRVPARLGEADHLQRDMLIEAADAARMMLVHASRTESLRAVMITSAVEGEGKTSTASHLAASLARAGYRTVLVDCDLRRPSIHRLFNQAVTPGVCELLRHEVGVDDTLRSSEADGLWILPAGRCDDAALGSLARSGLRPVLQRLREQFAFVVVDSSPILPVADALQVAQDVDGVILSVLRDVSRLPQVQAASVRLASLGVRTLGAVVVGTTSPEYRSSYG